MNEDGPSVGIIMGSQSDWETMQHAAATLDRLGIGHETRIVSAHRTPDRLYDYARTARESRGLRVIIAGAGGAAHLPGMAAALTPLPVLGVPIESRALKGVDSLLSIVQMPAGMPVATFAIGQAGAINAALFAAAILGLSDSAAAARRSTAWRQAQTERVAERPAGDAGGNARPGRDDRHFGRRPTRANDGARRRPARLPLPCLRRPSRTARPSKSAVAATVAEFADRAALERFAAAIDVATFEFENIPAEAVRRVAAVKAGTAATRDPRNRPGPPARKGLSALDRHPDTRPTAKFPMRRRWRGAMHDFGYPAVLKTRAHGL